MKDKITVHAKVRRREEWNNLLMDSMQEARRQKESGTENKGRERKGRGKESKGEEGIRVQEIKREEKESKSTRKQIKA